MKRRDFIKLSANTALLLAMSGLSTSLYADGVSTTSKTVIDVNLNGGPDFRHLIVPAYHTDNEDTTSYAYNFWKSRSTIFGKSTPSDLKQIYSNNYDEITLSGVVCGILKTAGWLKEEIIAGNVAIVNNVIGTTNRNHHHGQVILATGDLNADVHNLDTSGWMGRGSKILNENVVSLSSEVRLICNGTHPTDAKKHENSHVVSNPNSRSFGLYNYDTQADIDQNKNSYKYSDKAMLSRALSSYYSAKAPHIPPTSVYIKPMLQEQQLRQFGSLVKARLDTIPQPENITNLQLRDHENRLSSSYFARQIASLYDSYLLQDVFSMRFASMEYTGWDSHKNLRSQIEPKLSDMFGIGKGFDSLFSELKTVRTDSYDNSVMVISGEFGRQLLGNGAGGNDHGRGNAVLVIGGKVKGGFYGTPFPDYEIEHLNTKNADIEGKTSIFHVYGAIVNWQQNGLGESIFGDLSSQILEEGVDLTTMIEA